MRSVGGLTLSAGREGWVLAIGDAEGGAVAELAFGLPGAAVPGWEPGDDEWALTQGADVTARVRMVDGGDRWTITVTVDNTSSEPVELGDLGLAVTWPAGRAGWAFSSDLDGLLAVVPATDRDGGGVLLRLRRGFLRVLTPEAVFSDQPEPGIGGGRALALLGAPGASLGGHRRHEVVLELRPLRALADAAEFLPGWLPPTVVADGDEIELALPDQAIVAPVGMSSSLVGTDAWLRAPAGHHEIAVHGPRGVERIALTWFPPVAELAGEIVDWLVRRPAVRASSAAGFIVAHAVAEGLAPDPGEALDWLEQVDWLDRGTLLDDATAGVLAASLAERRQVDQVWDFLARRDVGRGYGLVVMRLWLASLSAFGEPDVGASALLRRHAPDPLGALELGLLTDPDPARLGAPVNGLIQWVGAGLPGRPLALSAETAAWAISLLKLCPESWPQSQEASRAAETAEGLLLADYAAVDGAGSTRKLDGLAWLLLGALGI